LSEEILRYIVEGVTIGKGLELAAYQPKFIMDQVVATCRFMEQPPRLEKRYIDYALDNLRVKRPGDVPREQRTAAQVGR
jgi:hypothetical protein